LSVGLRVISGANILLDIKESTQLFGQLGSESWVSVGDNFLQRPIVGKHMSGVQLGGVQGVNDFVTGDEDRGFCRIMICDSEDGIEAL
jgi:hypothetical protein